MPPADVLSPHFRQETESSKDVLSKSIWVFLGTELQQFTGFKISCGKTDSVIKCTIAFHIGGIKITYISCLYPV